MVSFKVKEEFWKNFDVSVVIPFYKKMAEFRRVFPLNRKYFERNGIEVVIVLDTPLESEELLSYIQQYPFVNWRIVMNDKPHEWRNPAKPLNVGIRHATKKYVMVCSPESEMVTDVIYILRKSFDDYSNYPHYAIGRVCFADEEEITVKTFNNYRSIPFGSIMFEREHAEQIHGYDETLSKWGGDDNNIRSRFDMIGVKELYFNEAMMAHRDINNNEGKKRRGEPFEKTPNNALRHFFFPTNAIANGENWGQDFDEIIYDWSNNKYAEQQLQNYANQKFIKYEMTTGYNKKSYPVILLVQSYNDYNGDVYKCTAVNFEEEKRDGYLDSNGDIIWENNSLEKRMAAKFSNKPCLECNLLPICHGGCSSKPLENGCNYCIFGFNEEKKMNAVMNKFLYNIIFKWKSMLHKT